MAPIINAGCVIPVSGSLLEPLKRLVDIRLRAQTIAIGNAEIIGGKCIAAVGSLLIIRKLRLSSPRRPISMP